jgi:hypothetical protein
LIIGAFLCYSLLITAHKLLPSSGSGAVQEGSKKREGTKQEGCPLLHFLLLFSLLLIDLPFFIFSFPHRFSPSPLLQLIHHFYLFLMTSPLSLSFLFDLKQGSGLLFLLLP